MPFALAIAPARPEEGASPAMQPTVISLGVVIRRSPGATRWARWAWKVVAVLPGAGPADWKELRRDGDTVEYHAATVPLELWASDVEAYLTGLETRSPSVYVVLRESEDSPREVTLATASPFEAQDYMDSGEEVVEQVAMPRQLAEAVREFVRTHHREEPFVKRRRDKKRIDLVEDGKGDPRIRQESDVYRAPRRRERVH